MSELRVFHYFGTDSGLIRQTNALAESLHTWIAANESKFRKGKRSAHTQRTKHSHPFERLQSASLVVETRKDKCLVKRVRRNLSRELFCVVAATRPRVRIAEIASIPTIPKRRQNLDGFLDSALAQAGAAQTLRLVAKVGRQLFAMRSGLIVALRQSEPVGHEVLKFGR